MTFTLPDNIPDNARLELLDGEILIRIPTTDTKSGKLSKSHPWDQMSYAELYAMFNSWTDSVDQTSQEQSEKRVERRTILRPTLNAS